MDRFKKFLILSITVSVASIILLLFAIPQTSVTKETFEILSNIRSGYLLLAISLHIFVWFLWAFRIKVMCSGIGSNISYLDSVKVVIPSLFAACITPSKFGGEPVRVYLLGKNGLSYGDATAVVIEERLLDALFLGILVPITLFLFRDYYDMALLPVFVGAASILAFFVIMLMYGILRPDKTKKFVSRFVKRENMIVRVNKEIDNFHASIWKFIREGRKQLLLGFIITIPYWIMDLLIASLILKGLGLDPMWISSMVAQMILAVVTTLPLTPGSSGIAEIGMTSLYAILVESAVLGVFVFIWRFVMFYMNLVIGGIVGGALSLNVLRSRQSDT